MELVLQNPRRNRLFWDCRILLLDFRRCRQSECNPSTLALSSAFHSWKASTVSKRRVGSGSFGSRRRASR